MSHAVTDLGPLENSAEHAYLTLDSGSQSNARRKEFTPDYEIDDLEKARLWDTQDANIVSHGKKIVDITTHGSKNQTRKKMKQDRLHYPPGQYHAPHQ